MRRTDAVHDVKEAPDTLTVDSSRYMAPPWHSHSRREEGATTQWDKTCAEASEQRPAGADHTSIPCIVPASRATSRSYVEGIGVREKGEGEGKEVRVKVEG